MALKNKDERHIRNAGFKPLYMRWGLLQGRGPTQDPKGHITGGCKERAGSGMFRWTGRIKGVRKWGRGVALDTPKRAGGANQGQQGPSMSDIGLGDPGRILAQWLGKHKKEWKETGRYYGFGRICQDITELGPAPIIKGIRFWAKGHRSGLFRGQTWAIINMGRLIPRGKYTVTRKGGSTVKKGGQNTSNLNCTRQDRGGNSPLAMISRLWDRSVRPVGLPEAI